MKKNLLFKMLAVLIVLITSINTAWGGVTGGYIYFDPAQSGWSTLSSVEYVISHDTYSCWYAMSNVTNTKLYYISSASWGDAKYIAFTANYGWTSAEGNSYDARKGYGPEGNKHTAKSTYGVNSGSVYLFYAANSNNDAAVTTSSPAGYKSGGVTDLNSTQTVKFAIAENGGTPAELTSGTTPAQIRMRSYKFVSGTNGSVSAESPSDWSAGSSTYYKTFTAARTATTTVTVSNEVDGYTFVGWYTAANGGTQLSTNKAYTYYPSAATTVYARFSHETTHSVSITYKCGATTVSTGTSQTIGQVTASNIEAPTVAGYNFSSWTLGNGVADQGSDLNANPISVKTLGSGTYTMQANYTEDLTSTWYILGNNTAIFPGSSTWSTHSSNMLRKASGHSTDDEGSLTINVKTLPANNSDYQFKVFNDDGDHWWGWTNGNTYNVNNSAHSDITLYEASNNNLNFIPNALGEYTLTVDWSGASPELDVTWPTSYTVNFGEGEGADGSASATYSSTSFSTGTKVENGKSITLTAPDADDGYSWDGWYNASSGGTQVSTSNPLTTTISSSNHDFYARYTEATYTVAFNAGDNGSVSPSGDQSVGAGGKTITATPDEGYMFTEWETDGDVTLDDEDDNPATVRATGTGSVTANFAERYILRGSTYADDNEGGGLAGWSATSNSSYTLWTFVGSVLTIRANLTSGDTKYKFKLVDLLDDTGHGQTGADVITASTKWTLDGGNDVFLQTTDAGNYTFVFDFSKGSNPEVSIAYPGEFICGDFTNWGVDEPNIPFDDNDEASVVLTEGNHEFKIIYAANWYGNGATIDGTTLDQTLSTSGSNCTISVPEGGDTYVFTWDAANAKLSVFTSADAAKAKLTKNKYIYCDARANSSWQANDFDTRFWLKNYGSGANIASPTCNKTNALEDWVYYAQVPNNDFVGRVQINRLNPSGGGIWTTTAVMNAYSRSNTNQNCLVVDASTDALTWGTYCPPMKTVTLEDNSTVTYGGNGTKATPYLVEKGGTIRLQAHTTKYFKDDNMTQKFLFFDAATKKVDQTDSAYNYTANASADVVHKMVVKTYNTYNSVNGDTIEIANTDTLFYQTVTCYEITYKPNSATSGSAPGKSKGASGLNVTLATNTGTLARSGYSFNGWNTAADGSGTHYDAGGTFSGISADTDLYAEWSPVALTLSTAGNWNNAANWTETSGGAAGCVPSSGHNVTISKEVTVNINNAVANSITFSSGGKLTIPTTGALEVTGTITNTNPDNIVINTDGSNQGALIFNNSAGTTQATVNMYSKAASGTFQYMAIPLASISVNPTFAGTGTYTYVWHEGTGWERRGYYTDLEAFEPIGLSQTSAHTYTMSGELAPTSEQTITLAYTSAKSYKGMNMIGNSWTAPISIAALTSALDAAKIVKTVYIYCTGADGEDGPTSDDTETAGQWLAIPIDASGWSGWGGLKVIPAMQAFLIKVTEATSVTLDYDDMVRTASSRNEKLRAPKREAEEDITLTTLRVADSRTHTDLNLFEGEKFTNAFDNGWEATFMTGDGSSAQFYAMSESDKMAVLAAPSLEGTVVGFKAGQETDYTISFIGNEAGYYLNDVKTAKSTLIAEGNTYAFTSDDSDQSKRFVISKTPMSPTGVENVVDGTNARKQMINGVLYIIRDGRIYNAEGALVK